MLDIWMKIEQFWNPLRGIAIFIPHSDWNYFEIVKRHLAGIRKRWASEEIFWILPKCFEEETEAGEIGGNRMYISMEEEDLLLKLYECCEISETFFTVKLRGMFGRKECQLISEEENILNGIFSVM